MVCFIELKQYKVFTESNEIYAGQRFGYVNMGSFCSGDIKLF